MVRFLRRSFGISAARMAVRPAVPWYWWSLRIFVAGGLLLAGAALLADAPGGLGLLRHGEVAHELGRLKSALERQETELAELRSRAAQAERQLQMERAATTDLAKQVKSLTFENAALKEDLAFFQSLMSAAGGRGEGTISVNRFRLQPEGVAGEFRYQMLLVQNGQRAKDFQGRLQFVLDVQHEGHKLVLVMPAEADREGKDYRLNFKFFQRIEGTFKLMPVSVLQGMQVEVFENGTRTPKLTQTLSTS